MGMTLQLLAEYTGGQFMKELGNLVVVIVGIAGALMTIYAVYIAYLFATASEPGKRKAARERLIKVVASALIIIGLASVLSVVNVRFNKVEGNISGPVPGRGVYLASNFAYNAEPSVVFHGGTQSGQYVATGEITLETKYLNTEGTDIDPEGTQYQFQDFSVYSPTDWPVNATSTFSINQTGFAKCKITLRSDNEYGISIPCVRNSNGEEVITVAVTFAHKDAKTETYSCKLDVLVLSADGAISFKLGESA